MSKAAIVLLIFSVHARAQSPARRAVDLYNAVESSSRMVAWMKPGAEFDDGRYLNYLDLKLAGENLPRAYFTGSAIYLKGESEPLKILDLRANLFSFRGQRLDMRAKIPLRRRIASLESLIGPRRAALDLWNWLFPNAYAASTASLTHVTGVVALAGLTSSSQCLEENNGRDCSAEFMGRLTTLAAAAGTSAGRNADGVFCNPDFRGGQKIVITGQNKNLTSIARHRGEIEIAPRNLSSDTAFAQRAAGELLANCTKPAELEIMNVALARRESVAPVAESATTRAPASAVAPVTYQVEEMQSGATR